MPHDEITVRVPDEGFPVLVRAFLDLLTTTLEILNQLDAEVSGNPEGSIVWRIADARRSSPLAITLRGQPCRPEFDFTEKVTSSFVRGVRSLRDGTAARPPHFNDVALDRLLHLTTSLDGELGAIVFELPTGEKAVAEKQTELGIRAVLELPEALDLNATVTRRFYQEYGTLRGQLDVVSVRANKDTFEFTEELTKKAITCRFTDPELFKRAQESLRKRIEVEGRIRYNNQDGSPASMQVEGFRVLGDGTSVPSFRDLEGLDITGGMDPVEFIRRLRDGD